MIGARTLVTLVVSVRVFFFVFLELKYDKRTGKA